MLNHLLCFENNKQGLIQPLLHIICALAKYAVQKKEQ